MPEKLHCPNCYEIMPKKILKDKLGYNINLDICFNCHLLWFDNTEASRLAPDSIIKLFELINQSSRHQATIKEKFKCPRCYKPLNFINDIVKHNKINYYRCDYQHGRLITFFQFLREKHFVRSLTDSEIKNLPAEIKQLRCTSCGGAINLNKDHACPYCRAPISVLDAKAVNKALQDLKNPPKPSEPSATNNRSSSFESDYLKHLGKESFFSEKTTLIDLIEMGINYFLNK